MTIDYLALAPILAAAGGAILALVADLVLPQTRRTAVLWFGVAGVLTALVFSVVLAVQQHRPDAVPRRSFCVGEPRSGGCSYSVDDFTVFLLVLIAAAALVALLASAGTLRTSPPGEYVLLVLASLAGALTLVGARDLITLTVGLETLTLPTYVLVGLKRGDRRSAEAAVKYLLVSVSASAVMLLGMALIYGLTGDLHLAGIAAALAARPEVAALPLVPAALVFVLAGFGFKVALAPFHWWAPDVYQGAPVPVAAYLATVSKAGGVGGLLLIVLGAFPTYGAVWGTVLAVLAAISMTLGNLVALRQRDVVRLLAWSSVAHAGYLLAPLGVALTVRGSADLGGAADAVLGYLALYVAMNLGAFCCLAAVESVRTRNPGLRGLAARRPLTAAALAFFLLCLAGLPPGLAGLVAKVVVFRETVVGGLSWLAVVMAVNTVIGLAYYLRVAAGLFRPAPSPVAAPPVRERTPAPVALAVGLAVAATVLLGFLPQLVLGGTPFSP